ncbi:hypothetical protein [Leuconostoc lactis]|uniref:hypothetical protein n=1 Tax=Leuconostoc lactis TaxID=1246 RepID=UPI0006917EB1|nr:hypothetical protein [Leuconostoc lactis]GEB41098.1 hypothetical protein LLA04_14860 [Leuconostoc lactis]GLY46294.1 hypothetical protein Llac01_16710 [Leuconostoc lactis]
MAEFLCILWLISTITFVILSIIYLIDKFRKRQGVIGLRTLIISLCLALGLFIALFVTVRYNQRPDQTKYDPKSFKTGVSYEKIARKPSDYKGQKLKFTGSAVQVIENEDGNEDQVLIRLAVDGNDDDIILVEINKALLNGSRILEHDQVTISGISDGTETYESTLNGSVTVPYMIAKIVDNQGKYSSD